KLKNLTERFENTNEELTNLINKLNKFTISPNSYDQNMAKLDIIEGDYTICSRKLNLTLIDYRDELDFISQYPLAVPESQDRINRLSNEIKTKQHQIA